MIKHERLVSYNQSLDLKILDKNRLKYPNNPLIENTI